MMEYDGSSIAKALTAEREATKLQSRFEYYIADGVSLLQQTQPNAQS